MDKLTQEPYIDDNKLAADAMKELKNMDVGIVVWMALVKLKAYEDAGFTLKQVNWYIKLISEMQSNLNELLSVLKIITNMPEYKDINITPDKQKEEYNND